MIRELLRISFIMQLAAPCTVAGPPLGILYPSGPQKNLLLFFAKSRIVDESVFFYRFIAGF